MIYLDNAATTPICKQAQQKMIEAQNNMFFNASAFYAEKERQALASCEQIIMKKLKVSTGSVVFTSGATESNNLAMFGLISHQTKGLVVAEGEHASILTTAEALNKKFNTTAYVKLNTNGEVDLSSLAKAVTDSTTLVCVCLVNSQLGSTNNIEQIYKTIKQINSKALLLVDATQGFLKTDFDANFADIVTFSAHKFGGPKGVGAIYIKPNISIVGQIVGGQNQSLRSGTINLPAIVGMQAAIENYSEGNLQEVKNHLLSNLPHFASLAVPATSANIFCITLDGIKGEFALNHLAQKQIYIATASACSGSSKQNKPLAAIAHKAPLNVIRVSTAPSTTCEQIDTFLKGLKEVHDYFS